MFELSPQFPDRFFASNFSVGPVDFVAAAAPKADVRPARRRAVPCRWLHTGEYCRVLRHSLRVCAWPNSAARSVTPCAQRDVYHLAQEGSNVPTGLVFSSLMVRRRHLKYRRH